MRTPILASLLLLVACGGAVDVIGNPVTAPTTEPDASSPPLYDAGAPDVMHDVHTPLLDAAPEADAEARYVIKGDEAYDRTTGLTWYRRFLYGSASLNNAAVCDSVDAGMRRATVAEGLTILLVPPIPYDAGGQYRWDYPFYWSDVIASEASDGCINLPPFSVTAICEGDLINNLCVKGP